MEIFKLFGTILVNTDEADKSMQSTDKKARSLASSFGKGIATAGKWGAAIGTAAAGAAAGMYKLASNAASSTDEIDKMSQKIGISRTAYQELAFAMSQSGAEVSDLQAGMKSLRSAMDDLGGKSSKPQIDDSKVQSTLAKYNNAVLDAEQAQKAYDAAVAKSGENSEEAEKALVKLQKAQNFVLDKEAQYNKALEGTSPKLSKAAAAMNDLGISVVDTSGNLRDDEEVMFEVLTALQKMTNETEKARYAALIFGKSGTELMPLLNGTADSLDNMRQQAHDLGLVLEDDVVKKGVNMTDAMDQMKRALKAVMTQLGARLMPVIEKAANFVTSNIPRINKLIEQISPIFERAFDQIMPVLMDLASELLPQIIDVITSLLPYISEIFSKLAPVIAELVQKLAPVLVKIIEKLLPPLLDIIDSLMDVFDALSPVLDLVLGLVESLIDPIADILKMLKPIIEFVAKLLNDLLKPIMPILEAVADVLTNMLGGAISSVAALIGDGLIPILDGLIDFLSGDFEAGISKAGEGFVNVFSNALGFIDSIFGTNLQKWYNEVTAFWRDAGAKLYEVLHADEISENNARHNANQIKTDLILTSNEYMRQGMDPTAALKKAQDEILDTAEEAALFNQYIKDEITDDEARRRWEQLKATGQINSFDPSDYYASHYSTPHLASGGVVYGKTLAVVGDNKNVKSDPEVVAPLSEFERISEHNVILEKLDKMTDAIVNAIISGGNVVLNIDGQKVATAAVNRINAMRYTRGAEVVI